MEAVEGQLLITEGADLGRGLVAPTLTVMLADLQGKTGAAEGMKFAIRMEGGKGRDRFGLPAIPASTLGRVGGHGLISTACVDRTGKASDLGSFY